MSEGGGAKRADAGGRGTVGAEGVAQADGDSALAETGSS